MKKILFLIIAMCMTITSNAQRATNDVSMVKPWKSEKSINLNAKIESQLKEHSELMNKAVAKGSKAAPRKADATNEDEFIKQPEGKLLNYMLSAYAQMYDAYIIGGLSQDIYYNAADSSIYIKDFLSSSRDGCFVKAKLTKGDIHNGIITIPNHALCGDMSSFGVGKIYATLLTKGSDGKYGVDKSAKSYDFKIINDTIHGDSIYVAGTDASDKAYFIQGQFLYKPIDPTALHNVVVPANATTEYYSVSQTDIGGTERTSQYMVRISRDNNDFYFSDVFSDSVVFKGTLGSDNIIRIDAPQFSFAADRGTSDYTVYKYINSCTVTQSDEGEYSYYPNPANTIELTYDPTTGEIDANDTMMIAELNGNVCIVNDEYYLYAPHFTKSDIVIPTIPATATVTRYQLNSEYDDQGHHQGALVKIARDGDKFYFMDTDGSSDNAIMTGTLNNSTNTITVPAKQFIGIVNKYPLYVGPCKSYIKETESDDPYAEESSLNIAYERDSTKMTITFTYDPNTMKIKCNDVMAILDQDDNAYPYFINPEYTPIADKANKAPANAEISYYVLSSKNQNNLTAEVIPSAKDGNDIYFSIPMDYKGYGSAVIKGTIDGDKVKFAIPQFASEYGLFLRVGTKEKHTTQSQDYDSCEWNEWTDNSEVSSAEFDKDASTGIISYDGDISVVDVNGNMQSITSSAYVEDVLASTFNFPVFTPYKPEAATPADPYDLTYDDKDKDYWGDNTRFCFNFYIPNEDVNGNFLSYDSISYRIYMDTEDSVFVFTPAEYPNTITESTTEMWFNTPASNDIPHPYYSINARMVYMFQIPKTRIGIQSRYHFGNDIRNSNIVWYNIPPAMSINNMQSNSSDIVNVKYYDITGREVSHPQRGIIIRKTMLSDGSAKTEKMFVK